MAVELWLKYVENGETKRILVEGNKFAVGRHSESNLSIAEPSLSRKHIQIERFNDIFIISDLNSTYGTKLNGESLNEPMALNNGDKLILGGGFEIKVEVISDEEDFSGSANDISEKEAGKEAESSEKISGADSVSAAATPNRKSLSLSFFVLAPLLGFCFVGMVLSLFYAFSDKKQTVSTRDTNYFYPDAPSRTPKVEETVKDEKTPEPSVKPTAKAVETPTETPNNSNIELPSTPQNTNDTDKIERSALAFTRRISINDNNYVFSRSQLNEINVYIKNFAGSAALRDNLKAVRQNAGQFRQLADSKGLKPQFLATAALAKIGNNRGNPVQTAQEMLSVLGELKISLGNELTDDNLLIIAAFDQGTRGEFRAMRNTVEVLSKQPGVDARRARTIWYLREKGKLSDAQYQFALRFLAIGAVSQKPSDFNVQTESVIFD